MSNDYKGPKWYEDVYNLYWWKSLWKILSKDLSEKINFLKIPTTYCLRIKDILDNGIPLGFEWLNWKDIVLKFSKVWDDFSVSCERWKNSSTWLPKLKWDDSIIDNVKNIVLSEELDSDIKSIILDEMIKLPNNYLYLVIFDGYKIKIEISRNDRERLFFELDVKGNITYTESNSKYITKEELPYDVFEKILEIHKQIFAYFWKIPVNTEWFFWDWEYTMIQVRPTPNEQKDENKVLSYNEDGIEENRVTKFVYWVFDFEGIPKIINKDNYLIEEKSIFILDQNHRWFSNLIKARLENGLPTILIDIFDWFHISHDPNLLPHYWEARKNFNYISYLWDKDLLQNKVRLVSNWEEWQILIYKDKEMSKDKFEARDVKKVCNFKYHNNTFEYPEDKVTSTWVIAFTEDRKIIVVEIDRWYDIPWGHVQDGDSDFIDAVRREAMEEAYVHLKDVELSTVVESDYFWKKPDELTYMLFYTASVDNLLDFIPNDESFSREKMDIKEFISKFKWDKELITNIVNNAYKQNFNT